MHLKSKIKKIVLSVLIVILITLMAGGNAGVKGIFKFPDTVGHRFELEIIKLSNKGIIEGYPDGTFRPDAMVKRSEIATLLVKVKNLTLYKPSISKFKDVATNNWAYGYIMAIQKDGLMVGYPDGTFKPDANVTRAELAVVLGRLKGLENEASKITYLTITAYDINKVASWSMPYIELGFQPKHNFLTGRVGYIAPQANATRGEVAYGLYVATNPPKFGGTVKAAIEANPATIDAQSTTSTVTAQIATHIFETLFTYDEEGQPIPMLIDSYNVSKDAKTYTFSLRKGVKFHDGKEMTADDVVASIARWSRLSGPGKTLFTDVESWTVLDRYTAQMVLKKPVGIIPAYLGNPYNPALIYEKTVIDIAGDKPLTFTTEQLIGTGPYKFVEFIPDVHVKLVRFEDYVARNDIINGIGGRKTVYHEVLLLNIVPDGSVRVLGTTTKLYDFATAIVPDQYGKLRINPNIVTSVALKGWETAVFNKKLGVFTNVKIRQAFLAALDMEACMKGGLGNADFWILGPHLVPKGTAFYSTAGSQWYNQKNIERAKSLLAEAGYKGEPIRWLVSTDYPDMYNIALISKDQLEKAGFVIDLQVSDWATLIKRRADEKLWDAFSTYFTYSTDPAFISILNPTYLGWYTSPTMEQYLSELRSETDLAKRKIIWDKAQELFWVDVPVIKYGDAMNLNIYRTILEGYRLSSNSFYFFWNVWKES